MRRALFRKIKEGLVSSGLDNFVATVNHKFGHLSRLIPDRTFYSGQVKKIRRNGVNFLVRPADLSQWFLFVDHNDLHVQAALKILDSGRNGLILDVGANVGHFSLTMAKHIEKNKWKNKIQSFEPNPNVFALLKENIALNPSLGKYIYLNNFGIGARAGILLLNIPYRNSGAGTLVASYEGEPHDTHEIAIKTLDSLFVGQKIEFIKIDVEGYEYYVLMGAQEILSRYHPAIYIETIFGQPKQTELFQILSDHGYQFLKEEGNGFVPIVLNQPTLSAMNTMTNILAIAP